MSVFTVCLREHKQTRRATYITSIEVCKDSWDYTLLAITNATRIRLHAEAAILVVLFQSANTLLVCVSNSKELHTPQSSSASGQGQVSCRKGLWVCSSFELLTQAKRVLTH